jgi:hypothetical protein
MLSLKFHVTMATRGTSQNCQKSLFCLVFSINIYFKVLQLLNVLSQRLFSVGYTFPYDRTGVIFSLSQVQNFLGDEGDYCPLQTPQTDGGTSPFWQPPDVSFGWGAAPKKCSPFLATFLKRKHVLGPK